MKIGDFQSHLEDLGAEGLASLDLNEKEVVQKNTKKFSAENIIIAWVHYKTNFLKPSEPTNLFDDDDDDSDEDEEIGIEDIMPEGFVRFGQKPMDFTPWGKFEKDNPMSPLELYDLQVVYFKGFSANSFKDFKALMNSVEGIGIWGQIDAYSIIVGPAKLYEFQEVRYNLEYAIHEALGIDPPNFVENLTSNLNTIRKKSLDLFTEGTRNITIVFLDKNNEVELIENYMDEHIQSVDDLVSRVNNIIVFIDGEIYYE